MQVSILFFQAVDGVQVSPWFRGLGDVYKSQLYLLSKGSVVYVVSVCLSVSTGWLKF